MPTVCETGGETGKTPVPEVLEGASAASKGQRPHEAGQKTPREIEGRGNTRNGENTETAPC